MFKMSKAQIGDALMYRIKPNDWWGKVIDFFTLGGGYSHVAMYIGNGYKVEASAETNSFIKTIIKADDHDIIDIFRLKDGIIYHEQEKLKNQAISMLGTKYDYLGLIGTVRSAIGKLFNMPWIRQSRPIMNDEKKYFCSEGYAKIYEKALGIDICPECIGYVTTPNDIPRSNAMEMIL